LRALGSTTIRLQKVMTTENYKDGKLEGLRSVFISGKIAEETSYKQNLKRVFTRNTLKME
jgi:antitoxin component YwqK of YwqJK toxin-antitoxin module